MRHLLPPTIDRLVFPDDLFKPELSGKPPADDGVVANARLTAMTGATLVVLFAAEGITLLDTRGWIDWHAGIGIAAGVVVLLKLASTGYRMARYYQRDGRYVASGPPKPLMRILAPFLVLATVAVIGTGIMTIYEPSWRSIHKLCFFAWIGLVALHVLVYFWRLPRVIAAPRGTKPQAFDAPWLGGLVLALVLLLAGCVGVWFVGQMPPLP